LNRDEKIELLELLEERKRREVAEKIDCSQMSRDESNEFYTSIKGNIHAERKLCRTDLFYLLACGLDRKDANSDWVYDRCREVQAAPDGFLDLWAREHYKQNLLTEDIFTPDGWRKFGDLRVGDYVFSPQGKPVEVLAMTPIKTDPEQYSINFKTFQNDISEEIVTGSEHRWKVNRRVVENGKEKWGSEIVNTKRIFELTSQQKRNKKKRWLRVLKASALEFPEKEFLVEPYILGAWLGDGSCGSSVITNGNDEIILKLKGKTSTKETLSNTKKTTVPGLITKLKELGLGAVSSSTKFIPESYFLGSIHQRFHLLNGLMDTDGGLDKKGRARFVSTSEELASGVERLLWSLGYIAHKYNFTAPDNGPSKDSWVVSFNPTKESFSASHHKEKIRERKFDLDHWYIKDVNRVKSKPARCIQVEGGMYLIGRNNIPTCNSTIITFALSIQNILKDPDNTLIGIFSHTRPIAKAFLEQIKRELESNEYLKKLFPDILYENPRAEATKWSLDSGIIVKRKSNPKEATVEAWGLVDGQPTSKHFTVLVYDDVVTRESVTTSDQIKKVTGAWELSLNLGAQGGKKRYVGTRYHFNDTYQTMMDRGSVIPRIKPATESGKIDGIPVFLKADDLSEKRRDMGPYTFSCQMLQDPVADRAMSFNKDWLKFYDSIGDTKKWNKYLIVDPASSKKSTSDYTVMMVIGLSPDQNYYLLDAIRDRLNLTQRAAKLFEMHRNHNPRGVGYERYGLQADVEHMKYVMEQKNYRFNITELGGAMPKEDRIKKLIPVFEQGRFWMPKRLSFIDSEGVPRDFVQLFIDEEYTAFPVCVHDDMLDDTARILDPTLNAEFPRQVETNLKTYEPISTGSSGWMG